MCVMSILYLMSNASNPKLMCQYEDLLSTVHNGKLKWSGPVARTAGLFHTILQLTMQGKRKGEGKRKNRLDSTREHTWIFYFFCIPGAGIIEADDCQVTTVFTVQLSFHNQHSRNRVSWSVTKVGEQRDEVWLHVRRWWQRFMILSLLSADGGVTVGLWKLSSLDGLRPSWYRPLATPDFQSDKLGEVNSLLQHLCRSPKLPVGIHRTGSCLAAQSIKDGTRHVGCG